MNITVNEFVITLSTNELWTLAHAMRHNLESEDKAAHCAKFNGWETFISNNGPLLNMYKSFCERLGRTDLYDALVQEQQDAIKKFKG